jgi:hypothetical protein
MRNCVVYGLLIHRLRTSGSCLRGYHLVFFSIFKHAIVICHLLKVCDFVALTVKIVSFCVYVIIVVIAVVAVVRDNEIVVVIVLKNEERLFYH